jgi:hypothetical protein
MVTSTTPREEDPQEGYLDEPDPDVDAGLPSLPDDNDTEDADADTPTEDSPVEAAPVSEVQATPSVPSQPRPGQKVMSPEQQQQLNELYQRRSMEETQKWRDQVGQSARQYEQGLTQQGYSPAMARDQARRYVQQEQKFKQQEEESAQLMGFVEGRQVAAMHYLEKEGLADKQMLNDLRALQQTNTPLEMEKEAKRMKQERSLRAENARLKQGQVPAQTFDNSQGSAQASSSSDQRLMDAYINGDRSQAAVDAVKRVMQ